MPTDLTSRTETLGGLAPAKPGQANGQASGRASGRWFWRGKRLFDVVLSLIALPLTALFALCLLPLNIWLNPGPLFFAQERMGRDLKPFRAYKFRTMQPTDQITRGAADPVEHDRITALGAFLRRTRLDEMPQFLNILLGEMSFVGPRPDFVNHARDYLQEIPGYADRHQVLPGLSGLAQVRHGYAEGIDEARQKVRADLIYIRNADLRMELRILWLTVLTVLTSQGR